MILLESSDASAPRRWWPIRPISGRRPSTWEAARSGRVKPRRETAHGVRPALRAGLSCRDRRGRRYVRSTRGRCRRGAARRSAPCTRRARTRSERSPGRGRPASRNTARTQPSRSELRTGTRGYRTFWYRLRSCLVVYPRAAERNEGRPDARRGGEFPGSSRKQNIGAPFGEAGSMSKMFDGAARATR
jgi:hypothetical protein